MPNAQCPMPNALFAPCPMPNALCPVVPHVKARKAIYYISQQTIIAILKILLDEVCCGSSNRLF